MRISDWSSDVCSSDLSWMRFMLTPSANDAGYGGHIWLNRSRPAGGTPALWPDRGPNDLFACIGHQGQYIIVSPSQRVTIVRLGITKDDQFPELRRHLAVLQGERKSTRRNSSH